MDNAIIRTTNFTGMDNGVVYHLNGMSPQTVAGRNILYSGWGTSHYLDEDTSLFSGYDGSNALAFLQYIAGSSNHIVSIGTDKIYDISTTTTASSCGLLHTILTNGSDVNEVKPSYNPDIIVTTNNNLLYTSAHHLGVAYKFKVDSATSTSITITSATLYATYGIDSDTGTNKIFNLTKKEEYTNTTNNPTDTLNFTTAAVTPEAGDEILVFVDNRKEFNVSDIRGNHFANQDNPYNWVRQIKLLGSDYWILNGNYVSSLNVDESNFSATAKRLPYNTQATSFDINNGMMLVGGDYLGAGKLMLWDTYSDGWLSILTMEKSPSAIKAYKNGWLVVIGSVVYYTDGYQIQELSRIPDLLSYGDNARVHYNGVEVVQNNIIFNVGASLGNRAKSGIYIFDTNRGWSYTAYSLNSDNDKYYSGQTAGVVYLFGTEDGSYNIWVTGVDSIFLSKYFVNKLVSTAITESSCILFYDLPTKIRANKIELKLGVRYNARSESLTSANVTVNYGDGNRLLFSSVSVGASSTASLINNTSGDINPAYVGQEVLFLNGATSGERTYITDISGDGTTNEAWTISPELSTTPTQSSNMVVMNLLKSETKTITNGKLISNLTFNIKDFYSDKLYVEVVINGNPIFDVLGVNIY